MIDERHLNGATGDSKSYTVTNKGEKMPNKFYEQLQDQSEGDWVKVVRCKDCRFHEREQPGMVWCPCVVGSWMAEDGFCSMGEREENAETD